MSLTDATAIAYGVANVPTILFQQVVQAALIQAATNIGSEQTDDVQTLSVTGSPTGGTFVLAGGPIGSNVTVNWNEVAGTLQAKIAAVAAIGVGQVICSGGPLPGTAITITWSGTLAGNPQQILTLGTNSLTGGSSPAPAVAHTTVGVSVAKHTARQTLATNILSNPGKYVALFALAVSENATVQTDWPGPTYVWTSGVVSAATRDNDIQFVVNSMINNFLGT
jgi:hypothetical protein